MHYLYLSACHLALSLIRLTRFPTRRLSLACAVLLTSLIGSYSLAFAAPAYVAPHHFSGSAPRIDGQLRDWPAQFEELGVKQKGNQTKVEVAFGYDEQALYVAAKISDRKIIRSPRATRGEDHLRVSLLFPSIDSLAVHSTTLEIYPGIPGSLPGLARVNQKKVTLAKVVELKQRTGYLLEARLPWSTLSKTKRLRLGIKFRAQYFNSKQLGSVQSVMALSKTGGSALPLVFGAEAMLLENLVDQKELSAIPVQQAFGNVAQNSTAEMVAIYGKYLVVLGPEYQKNQRFFFNKLNIKTSSQVEALFLSDFNGDSQKEVVIVTRQHQGTRRSVQVLELKNDGVPVQIFQRNYQPPMRGNADAALSITQVGAKHHLTIREDNDLPAETFVYRGAGLVSLNTNPPEADPRAQASGAHYSHQPPPPRRPTTAELLKRVYALYRSDRRVKKLSPRFDLVTNLSGGKELERLVVHGKDLVIFGPGFKKGLSYTYLTIGVKSPEDILSITTRDLVGDGKAEIIVHGLVKTKASEGLGGQIVTRQALFIYKVIDDRVQRVFAAETARTLSDQQIIGRVRFISNERSTLLQLSSFRAIGWSKTNYPFPEDRTASGGLEPLLLPWSQQSTRSYSFKDNQFRQN